MTPWRCEAIRRDGTRCPHRGADFLIDGEFVSLCGRHRTGAHASEAVAAVRERRRQDSRQVKLPGVEP